MEDAPGENCSERVSDEGHEHSKGVKDAESQLPGHLEEALSEDVPTKFQRLLSDLGEFEKQWIMENFKLFENAREMLKSEECKNLTRFQCKKLEPVLNDVIAEKKKQSRSILLSEEVQCDQKLVEWICDYYESFSSEENLVDSEELDGLTRRQLETLEKVLKSKEFKTPHKCFGKGQLLIELRHQIHKETGLEKQLCHWVANSWLEGDNLEKIIENDKLENITRKQQKEMIAILENNRILRSVSPGFDQSDSSRDLIDFVQSSNFDISDSTLAEITELRGMEGNILKIVNILQESNLEIQEKYQLLDFISDMKISADTIKVLFESSREYVILKNEFEHLANQFKIDKDLSSHLVKKLSSFQSEHDFDQFEDLTKKQTKILKEKLRVHVNSFVELKRSIDDIETRIDLNDETTCTSFSSVFPTENTNYPKHNHPSTSSQQSMSFIVLSEDTVEDSKTFASSTPHLEAGFSNESMHSDDELNGAAGETQADLSNHTCKNPSSSLATPVANDDERHSSPNLLETVEPKFSNMQATTFPLITCKEVSQGDAVVEKFSVRADQVEKLCNFDEECPRFYKDFSSGLMIDFPALNDYKIAVTGLFGRFGNAKKFLQTRLDEGSFANFERNLQNEDSGMYFVMAKVSKKENISEGFLYFYSKGDDDYDNANPKSRSVHFFRYITQLTANIVLLFDEKDHHLMTEIPPEESGRKKRCRKYQIEEVASQNEHICVDDIGSLPMRWEENQQLFASNTGLLIVKSSEKSTINNAWCNETIDENSKFESRFSFSQISADAEVCEEFMEYYIHVNHNDRYQKAKEMWTIKESSMRTDDYVSEFNLTLDFALALYIYRDVFPWDFYILKEFIQNYFPNDSSDQMKSLLQHFNGCLKVEFVTTKSLTDSEKEYMLDYIGGYCHEELPCKFVLRKVLKMKTGKQPPSQLNIRELIEWATKNPIQLKLEKLKTLFVFPTKSEKPMQEIEFLKNYLHDFMKNCKSDHVQFQHLVTRVLLNIEAFTLEQISRSRTLSKHVSHRQEKLDQLVQKEISKERSTLIKKCFFNILHEHHVSCTNIHNPSLVKDELLEDTEKTIKTISKLNSHGTTRFKVCYSTKSKNQRKTLLEIEKVCSRTEPGISSKNIPGLHQLTRGSIHHLEVPLCEIVNAYSIDASLALLLMNTVSTSVAEIHNISTSRKVYRVDFGKRISLSDFDVSKRLLCLYSERRQETSIHLYQFSENFKSHTSFGSYDLKARFLMDTLQSLCLQYSSKHLWVLEQNTGRLLRLNNKNGTSTSPEKLANLRKTTGKIKLIQMSPNAQCIFLTNESNETFPLMTGSCNLLPKTEDTMAGKYLYIQQDLRATLVAQKYANGIFFQKISILGVQQEMKLQERTSLQSEKELPDSESVDVLKGGKEHWIRNFLWMFVKFPCENFFENTTSLHLSAIHENMPQKFEKSVQASLNNILEQLKSTKKPSSLLETFISFHQDPVILHRELTFSSKCVGTIGDFVRKMICFTPLQIARCQGNEFQILEDGEPLSLEYVEDVLDLKEKVDLGLFEAIFNQWTGPVKVVSSMGKQTTGKSYLLNHLLGSSFNISGTRCTDGCWMTVEVVQDCLYVILDFEGLGSFERTDQDDMLLSLFNSSLSTVTLFKTEQRLDRDTDQLFSKFNLGSEQLRGTDKIFQGTFMIIVKDVAESDIEDIRKEFIDKINVLLHKEKQNNFISKMYQGGFEINPFPPFQTESFYNDVKLLREDILISEPLFADGHVFMDLMKLMLSKLAISDFTPVDRQQIDSRIKYLKNHMSNALKYGQLSDEIPKRSQYALTLLDKRNERISTKWSLELTDVSPEPFEMDDNNFSFVDTCFMSIVGDFNNFLSLKASNVTIWREQLELFLEKCLNNRCQRVEFWINENVALWKTEDSSDYEDILCALKDNFTLETNQLRRQMKFCDERCSMCLVKCTRIIGHTLEHCCSTNHVCTENCIHCKQEERPCKHLLGHENDHICKDIEHFCGKECSFNVRNNCTNECSLMTNHEGDHLCSLKVHICNAKCSLESCTSACQINCLVEHEVHKCSKEQCMADCCVKHCRNICSAKDHFHGFPELSAKFRRQQNLDESVSPFCKLDGSQLFLDDHFCGNEHPCGEECEEDGYCEVSVEKQLEEREEIFEGLRATFKYKRKFVQVGKKLACLQKVAPFEKQHEGDHSCTTKAKIHFCMDKCPTCENICDKPYDHDITQDNLHHTAHGNMTKCYFICNQEDFNVGDHKYTIGEKAVAEFCHMFCNSLGRGHIHVIECPGKCEDQFDIENDHRRHQLCVYGPDTEVPKDEIWHSAYWDSIGFQDPCTGTEIEIFQKCPYYCSAPNHVADNSDETEDFRSYCLLDLWHAPVMKDAKTVRDDSVTVSKDGHLFGCFHESKTFHWVLALDKSYSMRGQPWQDVMVSTKSFMRSRGSVSTGEKYSIVIYGSRALVGEEFQDVANFNPQSMTTLDAGGGTNFSVALSTADEVISRHLDENCNPVLVFMSDGGCSNGDTEMAELARKYLVEHKLKVYTIGFGCVDFNKLKQLAYQGGGKFIECTEAIDLKHTFIQIASEAPANVGVTSCK